MRVVPNLLDQYRKAFPFLRGEFPSGTLITIVMTSDGATRRHEVALRPVQTSNTNPHAAHQRNGTGRMLGAAFDHRQDASSSAIQYERPRRSKRIFRMVRPTEYKSDEPLCAAVLEDAGPDGPSYLDLPPLHWKRLNRSLVYTLSTTSASSSLQRIATITSQAFLKAPRSWATSDPKNSGSSSVDS